MYTLGQAARAVGRSKTTLGRYIKSGRLSASRAEDGAYMIDPAELNRVFHMARHGNGHMERHVERPVTLDSLEPAPSPETLALRQLLAERDRLVEEQAAAIRDLRHRLDEERAERRQTTERLAAAQERIAALLTDQRPAPTASPSGRSWWRWGRQ